MTTTEAKILDLAQAAHNPLRSANLRNDLDSTASSLVLLQAFGRRAVQQPVIDPSKFNGVGSELLPSVKKHQQTMQRNAAEALEHVVPAQISTLTDVLGFASMMDRFIGAMMPLLPSITDKPEARAQVVALMARLMDDARSRDLAARQTQSQLLIARDKLVMDRAALDADTKAAAKAIGDGDGALARLRKELDDLELKIGAQIGVLVVSVLAVPLGGAVIVAGVAVALLTAGPPGVPVIMGGIGIVVTGTTGLTAAASLLAADNIKLVRLHQDHAKLSMTLAMLKALSGQIVSLSDAAEGLADAAVALGTQWTAIREGISSVLDQVQRAADGSEVAYIIAALSGAQREWRSIAEHAERLMARLIELTPKQDHNIQSEFA